ncbi:MAG: bacillithiol biosynthesis deacetylase BshB1 [Armatimonadetes bacterium]|nr:bacillithiol biosynthesis deacetylase BshB1 [Armatimonadota bacterium]
MIDAVAIGTHPDDVEVGMGGTVLALQQQGWAIALLDLTDGEPTPTGSPEKRRAESRRAAEILGVGWRRTLPMPNRYLEDTIANRKEIAAVLRELRPRVLFAPYWDDAHPDHVAACRLIEASRFYCKLTRSDIPGEPFPPPRIYHYFSNHYRLQPRPSFILDITGHLERKLEAVRAYESQFNAARGNLAVLDRLRVHAAYWGSLIDREAGEVFVSREPIGVSGLSALCL